MNRLFVAAQNFETREWVPVAELRKRSEGYELRYTRGATRVPGFSGLGRMQALDKVYHSKTLFPFFANRLISKSRPEYRDYLRWLGLESTPTSPLEVLAITGGARATDSFEIIAPPRSEDTFLRLDFFPRGMRYLPSAGIEQLLTQKEGARAYLMRDVQNEKDVDALAIRTGHPNAVLIGYVPRYYCTGIGRLLNRAPLEVVTTIKRVNPDAPLDMKILLTVEASVPQGFNVLDDVGDFLPLTAAGAERLSVDLFLKTDLNI